MQEDILTRLQAAGQGHLVEHYHSIKDPALQQRFMAQLQKVDVKQVTQLYEEVYLHHKNGTQEKKEVNLEVPQHVMDREQILASQAELDKLGMEAVARG